MAIEKVYLMQNTSVIQDEVTACTSAVMIADGDTCTRACVYSSCLCVPL